MELHHYVLFICVAAVPVAFLRRAPRAVLLVLASLIFYASFDWRFPIVLVAIVLLTYWGGIVIQRNRERTGLFCWFFSGVVLTPLLLYKYVLPWYAAILPFIPVSDLDFGGFGDVLVPVGLSFYTFQCLGYLIDIHRRAYPADEQLLRLALFICFLPQLLAGPIERYRHLAGTLWEPPANSLNIDTVLSGLMLMSYGFFLKNVVGDRLALTVDHAFDLAGGGNAVNTALAFVGFAVQLFADFGGYSLIAVGAGLLFGVRLTQNFRQPFFSSNIVEFWQRWHVSLTRWVGDYIYRPLGRRFIASKSMNRFAQEAATVTITWFVIGMWHGANLTFAVFGLLQAALILGYKSLPHPRTGGALGVFHSAVGFSITFAVVATCFGLIRAPDLAAYVALLGDIFDSSGSRSPLYFPMHVAVGLVIMVAVEGIARFAPGYRLGGLATKVVLIQILVVATILLGHSDQRDFIYFRF